jgi:PPM family protein phosphatase
VTIDRMAWRVRDDGTVSTTGWSSDDHEGRAVFAASRSGRLVVVAEATGERAHGSDAAHEAAHLLLDAAPRDSDSTVVFVDQLRPTLAALNRHLLPADAPWGRISPSHAVSLALLAFCDSGLVMANMGDTRCYFSRAGKLQTLNRTVAEGSLGSAQVGRPSSEEDDAQGARALGVTHSLVPDISVHTLRRGDRILLCTAGFWRRVEHEHLAPVLMRHDSAAAVVDALRARSPASIEECALALSEYQGRVPAS